MEQYRHVILGSCGSKSPNQTRHNPIFRRASQTYKPSRSPKRGYSVPRPLLLIAVIALIAAVAHEPQLLLLLFEVPIVMITLVVASPALLPLFTLCMGALLALEVIQGIYREKHQHTYELICSSTPGSLHANWSFAKGILHRGGWFSALRWGSAQSLRLGRIVLGGALLLIVWLLLSDHTRFGFEQVRVLLLIALLLALYYTHLTQTLVLSLLIGLFSSSFDLNGRDAVFIGVCLYLFAQTLSHWASSIVLYHLQPAAVRAAYAGQVAGRDHYGCDCHLEPGSADRPALAAAAPPFEFE